MVSTLVDWACVGVGIPDVIRKQRSRELSMVLKVDESIDGWGVKSGLICVFG
jgi:hypothetical protein